MPESPLPGGFVNAVIRVGNTVRRPASAGTRFVADLLRLLEARGWGGAPRYLGVDDEGREVLSYLEGHVAWEPRQPAAVSSDESLATVARLVREFHDLTAGTPLAGDQEVVCHNDLSPRNTVYQRSRGELRPAAFIDWDLGRVSKVPSAGRRLARTLAALSGSSRYNQYRDDPPPCDRTHQTPP
ncbi:hypothetical protein ACWGIA_19415, partial [Streptomyces bobili]